MEQTLMRMFVKGTGDEEVMGRLCVKARNLEREMVVDFCRKNGKGCYE